MAYDSLKTKKYLKLLLLASNEGENKVTEVLKFLIQEEKDIDLNSIEALVKKEIKTLPKDNVKMVDLKEYDHLLKEVYHG